MNIKDAVEQVQELLRVESGRRGEQCSEVDISLWYDAILSRAEADGNAAIGVRVAEVTFMVRTMLSVACSSYMQCELPGLLVCAAAERAILARCCVIPYTTQSEEIEDADGLLLSATWKE